jgi:hypothetical protein
VANIRERLAANKQELHKFHMERFSLENVIEVEDKEEYHVEISYRFVALEDLDAEVEINTVWETERISKFQPKESRLLLTEEA